MDIGNDRYITIDILEGIAVASQSFLTAKNILDIVDRHASGNNMASMKSQIEKSFAQKIQRFAEYIDMYKSSDGKVKFVLKRPVSTYPKSGNPGKPGKNHYVMEQNGDGVVTISAMNKPQLGVEYKLQNITLDLILKHITDLNKLVANTVTFIKAPLAQVQNKINRLYDQESRSTEEKMQLANLGLERQRWQTHLEFFTGSSEGGRGKTKKDLVQIARARGLKGYSTMTKDELAKALNRKTTPKKTSTKTPRHAL